MGWNQVRARQPRAPASPTARTSTSCTRIGSSPPIASIIALEADHGVPFCAAIQTENLFACQFHPEKSQGVGLRDAARVRRGCMKLYPAIDLLGGKAVRLEEGRRDRATIFHDDPPQLVAELARGGADRLHVVDLDGAFAGSPQQTELIRKIVAACPLPVEVGGGIRDRAAIETVIALGASFVVLGTAAVRSPALVEEACRAHPGKIIVAVDARDGIVAVDGWTAASNVTAIELGQRAAELGRGRAALHGRLARRPARRPERRGDRAARARRVVRGDRVGRRRQPRSSRARCATRGSPRSSSDARCTIAASPSNRPPRWRTMLARRLIPCLDVKDGRVVKGINFLELRDAGDPVEQAAAYESQGADELCYLDISASPEGRSTIVDIVRRTADQVFMPLTVGGGVRSVADAERLLLAGADKIAVNTAAIRTPELVAEIAERFGNQAIVVAVDAKRRGRSDDGWQVFSHGGRTPEGLDALEWCRSMAELGAGELLVTSMDRDGTGTWLRRRADPRGRVRVSDARDRIGRRREARRSGRWPGSGRRCRSGGIDLPLRPAHDRRSQGISRRSWPGRAFMKWLKWIIALAMLAGGLYLASRLTKDFDDTSDEGRTRLIIEVVAMFVLFAPFSVLATFRVAAVATAEQFC